MNEDKPKPKSRWVRGSGVPRDDKHTLDYIYKTYHEAEGWRNGAKVSK